MEKRMQNSQSLVVQRVVEAVRATLETKLDAIVNLAYNQGFSDGLAERWIRQS